jgi:hypothetical protein
VRAGTCSGASDSFTGVDWDPVWLEDAALDVHAPKVWRGVESQSVSATSTLVDSHQEHDVLEHLLEASKPPLPVTAAAPRGRAKHFLLTTPFRYAPRHSSRFRLAGQGRHGLWYGARALRAACAEVAYWRTRFIADSAGLLDSRIVSHHTFFAAAVKGRGIDLMQPPWNVLRAAWTHGSNYAETHRLSVAVEAAGLQVIQYESARARGYVCFAVFTPDALREPRGGLDASRQEWICTATRSHVMMAQSLGGLRYEWSARADTGA